jgi:hypothetical protein
MLFAPTVREKVTMLTELFNLRKDMDRAMSPLIPYFPHSPDVRQLTIGQCPAPGSAGFPSDMHGLRLSSFADQGQHLFYNMCTSHYNDNLQMVHAEMLGEETFRMFVCLS